MANSIISLKYFLILWLRQDGTCYYCEKDFKPELNNDKWTVTVDHLKPKGWGTVNNTRNNLVLACNFCNFHKGCMSAERFKKMINTMSKKEIRQLIYEKNKNKPWFKEKSIWFKEKSIWKRIKYWLQNILSKLTK